MGFYFPLKGCCDALNTPYYPQIVLVQKHLEFVYGSLSISLCYQFHSLRLDSGEWFGQTIWVMPHFIPNWGSFAVALSPPLYYPPLPMLFKKPLVVVGLVSSSLWHSGIKCYSGILKLQLWVLCLTKTSFFIACQFVSLRILNWKTGF